MMASTHILTGALAGWLASSGLNAGGVPVVWAGAMGGLVPELDFLIGHHRKSLHYPYSYFIAALPLAVLYVLAPSSLILMLAAGFLSAGIHSSMDILAGAELRSWDEERWQNTAVYDHIRGRWIEPRRIVYGGSKADLLLSVIIYLIAMYFVSDIVLQTIFTALIAFSFAYTVLVRRITEEIIDAKYSTLNGYVRAKLKPKH